MPPFLTVEGLRIAFPGAAGRVEVVRGVDFVVDRGRCLALVGESGSGKSLTALALLGLVPLPGEIVAGRVLLDGLDLLQLSERRLGRIRGKRIGLVFQEPGAALDPSATIGAQIMEPLSMHLGLGRAAARRRAAELLEMVAMPDPSARLAAYPHQLSGGQRQRAMLAIALAAEPEVLVADEPTTALDVTIQAQIGALLADLRRELGLTVVLVSHDLALVSSLADRVAVVYAGRVVESAASDAFFGGPSHPYSRALLAATPRLGGGRPAAIPGFPPSVEDLRRGCAFAPRCPEVDELCREVDPPRLAVAAGSCRCHRPLVDLERR